LIHAAAEVPELWQRSLVAFGYYLEEQGSCSIYMAIALDTLMRFPESSVGMSMGFVPVGYSFSSILTASVMLHQQPTLWQLFGFIASAASICTFWRVVVMGDLPCRESPKCATDAAPQVSYMTAMSSAPFGHLVLLHVLVLAPCTALLGLVKVVGNVGGVDGSVLAVMATVCNLAGGLISGAIYDKVRASVSSGNAMLFIESCFTAAFAMMTVGCWCHRPLTVASGALIVVFLFGCMCPLVTIYVKDNFADSENGLVWGVSGLTTSLANFAFIVFFVPVNIRSISDFSGTFATSAALAATSAFILGVHQSRIEYHSKIQNKKLSF